jgi:hypothetical protein
MKIASVSRIILQSLALAALTAGAASTARAAWTVTILHPAGATASAAYGASGDQQVGYAAIGGVSRASLWRGTAASLVDLHPAGAASSAAYGVFGDQQVGYALIGGVRRASLWRGTAASWVDLEPWTGTAVESSTALGTSGAGPVGQQAGYARFDDMGVVMERACLWHETAESWVDLHPWHAGVRQSWAHATNGTQQVGWIRNANWVHRASLWSGTAASWVDLTPAGALRSSAYATSGSQQAGWAEFLGVRRAGVWRGSAASWVDLHIHLPGGPGAWRESLAWGVWTDGSTIRVAGAGRNVARARDEAILWTWTPPPVAVAVSGTVGLSGWTAPLSDPLITFEVREPGSTTALQTAVVGLSATGDFSFETGLPPGTYDVTAKGDRWLRARLENVTFTATGAPGLAFGELIPGDVVEDNSVDLGDFLALAATYEVSPPAEARADLNGDGAVDLADFLLLAANYEAVGAP